MESCSESEDQFFDSRDEISSISDLNSDCSEYCSSSATPCLLDGSVGYDIWTNNLKSVHERRKKFLNWMGLSLDGRRNETEELQDGFHFEEEKIIGRDADRSSPVLADCNSDQNQVFPCQSFMSCPSSETKGSAGIGTCEENSTFRIKNFSVGREFVFDELNRNRMLSKLREVSSGLLDKVKELYRSLSTSSLVQQFLRKEAQMWDVVNMNKKAKKGLLQKLDVLFGAKNWMEISGSKTCKNNSKFGSLIQRVQVRSYRKRFKELSALYTCQEFCAHEGSILTMKFSPDGHHLASAGKDGIVKVWKVTEVDRQDNLNISDIFSNKGEIHRIQGKGRTSESTYVIFPSKVFQILQNPIHEFHGHSGEVLALSWSQKGDLLSSSVDNTVRLWRVGDNQCIRVFPHNNYVTCVEFNPMDDNRFISGSIDGKVRIWEVCGCRVVDWIDIREIVTAVCYFPNGKGGIVGSIEGNCRFFDVKDNHLQLSAQVSLCGKKKVSGKRITGFQFFPNDQNKVMVASADSQIRILSGTNIICKFRGKHTLGHRANAAFTSDGKHIVSAGQDSNVSIWNCLNQGKKSSKAKSIWSCERFLVQNGSVAIPWCGMKTNPLGRPTRAFVGDNTAESRSENLSTNDDSPNCFLKGGFLLELLRKGSATWPAEKLPVSRSPTLVSHPLCKSNTDNYKFLRNACQNTLGMWGLVIVTAGWDGWIRTYLNYGLPIRF